ncbi:MAG: hypothetical protein QXI20_03425 [Candidatus Jordarchaeales archaeon]
MEKDAIIGFAHACQLHLGHCRDVERKHLFHDIYGYDDICLALDVDSNNIRDV